MTRCFEKTEIKGLTLSNRFVRSATFEGLADEEGRVRPEMADMLAALAKGRVGLVITGFAYVRADGQAAPFQTGIHNDDLIPDLIRLTEAVHRAGARIVMQIMHAGVIALRGFAGGEMPASPSAFENPRSKAKSRELTVAEITEIIEDFGRAAARIKESGFDGVQLHAAHGYLLSQFMSPFINRRGDRYGGTALNRARAVYETYEAVRGAIGDDFPVMIKINSEDFAEDGILLEDSVVVARNLAEMGLDCIEVSGGGHWSGRLAPSRTKIDQPEKEAYFRGQASVFKEKVHAPIMLVGGLRSLDVIEDVLKKRQVDYAALCRPFIREPDLVAR